MKNVTLGREEIQLPDETIVSPSCSI